MINKHFKLDRLPFGNDPECMFWGAQFCQAKGFVFESLLDDNRVCCVLGASGSGKTHLLRQLFENDQENLLIARIWKPHPTAREFFRAVLVEYGFEPFAANTKDYLKILRTFLDYEQGLGKTPVIVVDQADRISHQIRDEIARLVGLRQTAEDNLRIVFFGRPEFEEDLNRSNLGRQAMRRFHLYGLAAEEVADYLAQHLEFSGATTQGMITPAAIEVVAKHSGGNPGLINTISSAALNEAAKNDKVRATKAHTQAAVKALELPPKLPHAEARYTVAPDSSPFYPDAIDKLVVTRDGRILGSFLLTHRRNVIGRHPTSDILLDSPSVSIHHAQVFADDRGPHLLDLNSTNGTFVNFRKTRHHLLKNNDLIVVGDYRLKFVEGRAQKERPTEAAEPMDMSKTVVLQDKSKKSGIRPSHLRRIK